MISRIAAFVACLLAFVALAIQTPYAGTIAANEDTQAQAPAVLSAKAGGQGGKPGSDFATLTALPSFGAGSQALAVNPAGTVVVGTAWDRSDLLHAVRWTLQNGKWAMSSMPWPLGASSVEARGVSDAGDAAGSTFPGSTSRVVLWPAAGGLSVLGCDSDTSVGPVGVYAISGDGQVVAGGGGGGGAAVWQPNRCRIRLPVLFDGGSTGAFAVNGAGTIVGGTATDSAGTLVPVRWRFNEVQGQWHVEQLDTRAGTARGSNDVGDLAGWVSVPCNVAAGCQRAAIWSGGSVATLGTLGGADSWASDINASGDVVGMSAPVQGANTAYVWFAESQRMVQLPFKGRGASANAVSDVRVADGTRLVVGISHSAAPGNAVVWVVANP